MLASGAQKGSEKWAVRSPRRVSFPPRTEPLLCWRVCALLLVPCLFPACRVLLSLVDVPPAPTGAA